ncbi:hypothetical protein Hamer_G009609, partial [Homarus americanus]
MCRLNSTWCLDEGGVVNSSVGGEDVGGVGGGGGVEEQHGWPRIRQELQSQISNRPFMSTINVFLCVLGVTRAACFLIDPYTLGQVMPGFLGSVMWDVGYPCILSAFSLIQLAFTQLTQVKFRPETLRRKSALSLVITTHFALVLGSDIVTAFESHLQVVRWVVQTVFLSWGLVLCVTFLYGGARIIRLLRTIPHTAFQGSDQCPPNNKGILQLALLAQCNNIASSVLTAAAPSLLTPKIKITDEFDHTYSYVSEGSRGASLHSVDQDSVPSSRRASSRASISSDIANVASTSGVRVFEDVTPDIAEENEDQELDPEPVVVRRASGVEGVRTHAHSTSRAAGVAHMPTCPKTPLNHNQVKDKAKKRNFSDSDKPASIIIRVEEVGDGETTQDAAGMWSSLAEDDVDDIEFIDKTEGEEDLVVGVTREAMKGIIHKVPSVKSIDYVFKSETPTEETTRGCGGGGGVRKGSFCEGQSGENEIKPVIKSDDSEKCLKIVNGDDVPKRKKSLTWSEDTHTIDSCDKDHESKKPVNHDDNEKTLRDHHRRASTSSRRSSRNTEKVKLRHTRSYDLGSDTSGGRRRSSTVSSCSSRKGSENWQALPGPYRDHRTLGTSSPSSTRRNSRKSVKDEPEVESLLSHSPDVTLTSILNHIAYVNQTAATSKLPSSFKDSRKSQVQQVLVVTYVTAALGTLLSLALVYGLYGHFSSLKVLPRPPWLWFTYESSCRFLEFLMGCAMANITRQPVNRHPQYPYSLRLKQRNSLY